MNKLMFALVAAVTTAALGAPDATAQSIAIEGATVHTEPGKVLTNATIVVRNGRITAVGTTVRVPAGAKRIDGKGKIVTAGFVEASTNIGLSEVGMVTATNEGRFASGKDAVHAAYRVTDGYNPTSVAIPIARTGGVTSAVSTPRGGLIAGSSAWLSLADGAAADHTVKTPLAMYVSLGEGALASAAGSRGLALEKLREILFDAGHYATTRRNFDRNQSRKLSATRLDLEALQPVIRGRIPIVVRANRSSDILAALRLAKERKLSIIIEGGVEAWMVAKQLAAARVPVILNPIRNLPGSFDRIHVRDDAATVLANAGVTIAISTLGDGSSARTLRQLAGNAVANGLTRDQALAALTTGPAAMFGVRDRGRVIKGAAADLVLWSGDPLELSSRVEAVLIGGVEQSLRTRQTRLFERYRTLPSRN